MKKWVIWTMVIGTILLAGCVKTQSSVISFDTFSTSIKSPYTYQETKITTNTPEIQKIYTSINSGAQASILIANKWTLSEDSIAFANQSLKTLRSNLGPKWTITDTETITLSCGNDDIPASISTIEVVIQEAKGTSTRYVTQMYFIYQKKEYTISHFTQDKDEVKWIQKWFAKINCPKN